MFGGDSPGVLLGDLVDAEDVARGLLHLAVLVQEVPEARLGLHRRLGEDLHAVDLRRRVRRRRRLAPRDLVVADLGRHGERRERRERTNRYTILRRAVPRTFYVPGRTPSLPVVFEIFYLLQYYWYIAENGRQGEKKNSLFSR